MLPESHVCKHIFAGLMWYFGGQVSKYEFKKMSLAIDNGMKC